MTLSLLSVNPITLLVFVAVINGIAAAPFLAVTMLVASDRRIMGRYVNGRAARFLGWGTVALMTVAALLLLVI
jgi:Mn2+/Fe2+ NRAMP family transporter